MIKALNRIEKILIAKCDKNFITYRCADHGIYQLSRHYDTGECPWCQVKHAPLKDFDLLQAKFRIELKLTALQPEIV